MIDMLDIYIKLGKKWNINPYLLEDMNFLMHHDVRFFSTKGSGSIRFLKMVDHLQSNYGIKNIKDHHLMYMVRRVHAGKARPLNKWVGKRRRR